MGTTAYNSPILEKMNMKNTTTRMMMMTTRILRYMCKIRAKRRNPLPKLNLILQRLSAVIVDQQDISRVYAQMRPIHNEWRKQRHHATRKIKTTKTLRNTYCGVYLMKVYLTILIKHSSHSSPTVLFAQNKMEAMMRSITNMRRQIWRH